MALKPKETPGTRLYKAQRKSQSLSNWSKIDGFKKYIVCKSCGRRVQVPNLNRMLCDRCETKRNRDDSSD